MDDGITVKEFKHIPGVNDAEYIKKLEELHENDRRIISIAVAKIKKLSSQLKEQPKCGKWIERESDTEDKENGFETVIVCSRCDYPATTFYSEDCESRTQIRTAFCPTCGADMRGNEDGTD